MGATRHLNEFFVTVVSAWISAETVGSQSSVLRAPASLVLRSRIAAQLARGILPLMKRPTDVERLEQGVEAWNTWREAHPEVTPSLRRARLAHADLRGANLRNADLDAADLSESDLREAQLAQARFGDANLKGAILTGADLSATLFLETNLGEARLDRTALRGTDFTRANLKLANLEGARVFQAVFADTDLSGAMGLETCVHEAGSIVDHRTLSLSGGLPASFLRGCGLSDWLIEAYELVQPGLSNQEIIDITYRISSKRVGQAVQINSLFISYSHSDAGFVDAIEGPLTERGIRFWRDIHDATSGRLERMVDWAIRLNPTVLLVLSEHSVASDWVEHEARLAREIAKELDRDVLCPIALDDSWKSCRWPKRLREQIEEYYILDFSSWRNETEFARSFERLLRGLSLFYPHGAE